MTKTNVDLLAEVLTARGDSTRRILEELGVALYATDAQGVINFYNQAAVDLWGRSPLVGVDRWCGSLRLFSADGSLIPLDESPLAVAVKEGRSIHGTEAVIERPDGTRVWVTTYATPLRDTTGKLVGAVNAFVDISEHKRSKAAGQRTVEQLTDQSSILETIQDVAATVTRELDLNKAVQAVTDAATRLTEAEFGAFFYNVVDDNGETYMLYTLSGADRSRFADFPMPRATSLFGPTFRGDGAIRLDDVLGDPRYGKNPPHYGMPKGHLPVSSYLAVPVVARSGEVLGGLFFGHASPCMFSERHEQLAVGLSNWAAVAIENARLYRESQAAAEIVQRSETRYRTIFESARVSLWEQDFSAVRARVDELQKQGVSDFPAFLRRHPDTLEELIALVRVVDVNQETLRIYEASDKSELMQSLGRIFTSEARAVFAEEIQAVAKRDSSMSSETVVETLKGRRINVLFTMAFPPPWDSFDSVLVSILDITERKNAEDEVRQGQERLNAMADSVPSIVWTAAPDGTITYANEQWYTFCGLNPGENAGRWPDMALHEDDRKRCLEACDLALREGTDYEIEARLRRHDGEYRWCLTRAVPACDALGRVIAWYGTTTDIEARKQAEVALRLSEDRFRSIFDQALGGIAQKDLDGRYIMVNDRYCEITGRSREELLTMRMRDVTHPDDLAPSLELYGDLVNGGPDYEIEKRYVRPDGSSVWVHNSVSAIRSPTGEPQSVLAVSIDISDRKQAEEKMAAAAFKDQFLGLVSHELRTPISTVVANALILLRQGDQLEQADRLQALQDIATEAEKLQKVIENLLLLTRIEASHGLTFEPLSFDDIVTEQVESFSHRNLTRGIDVTTDTSLPRVNGQRMLIAMVIENLISNADKYSPPEETIEICIRSSHEGEVEITVSDHGIGIDESELPDLFTPFYRAGTAREYATGMGLGLAVCKRIVEVHGGRIWATRRSDGGSDFRFTIPSNGLLIQES
jgi:PAS domain S-box-containing protein